MKNLLDKISFESISKKSKKLFSLLIEKLRTVQDLNMFSSVKSINLFVDCDGTKDSQQIELIIDDKHSYFLTVYKYVDGIIEFGLADNSGCLELYGNWDKIEDKINLLSR